MANPNVETVNTASGKWLLAENQDSDSIVVFRIDPQSGKLTPTGHKLEVPMPVCAKFKE